MTNWRTYWQKRLEDSRGQVANSDALNIVIKEDWNKGGAGNGLGSLYAYIKACEKAQNLYGIDILEKQKSGASVALYHTAGKGMRLFPMAATEYNNKSGVKLPGLIILDGSREPITLLEAVIKQTALYAPDRKGRLSVFWGDQILIPSESCDYSPKSHIDILAKFIPLPTHQQWNEQKLDNYGLFCLNSSNDVKLIDKSDFSTFQHLLKGSKISVEGGMGLSLGSFSLSLPLTLALIQEFKHELDEKKVKMDSDPFFWMPLTLDEETYLLAVPKKGCRSEEIRAHFMRMQAFKARFCNAYPKQPFF